MNLFDQIINDFPTVEKPTILQMRKLKVGK